MTQCSTLTGLVQQNQRHIDAYDVIERQRDGPVCVAIDKIRYATFSLRYYKLQTTAKLTLHEYEVEYRRLLA